MMKKLYILILFIFMALFASCYVNRGYGYSDDDDYYGNYPYYGYPNYDYYYYNPGYHHRRIFRRQENRDYNRNYNNRSNSGEEHEEHEEHEHEIR